MSRRLTLKQAAAYFRRAGQKLEENVEFAERLNTEMVRAEVVRLSSGPLKLKVMRRKAWDHPYAKRHSRPRLEPDITNVQSGDFREDWEIEAPRREGGAVVSAVKN